MAQGIKKNYLVNVSGVYKNNFVTDYPFLGLKLGLHCAVFSLTFNYIKVYGVFSRLN